MKIALLLLPVLVTAAFAGPSREAGLSLHMLPARVAKAAGAKGGFTATDPITRERTEPFPSLPNLLTYIDKLPAATKENGVWVVYTNPDAYSAKEQSQLEELIQKLKEKGIRTFSCRASALPAKAWKEGVGIPDGN